MKHFYRFLIWWAEFDLVVARSTGRGPHYIAAAAQDLDRWQMCLWQEQYKLGG